MTKNMGLFLLLIFIACSKKNIDDAQKPLRRV
jgi:hypothetical protein